MTSPGTNKFVQSQRKERECSHRVWVFAGYDFDREYYNCDEFSGECDYEDREYEIWECTGCGEERHDYMD